MLVVRNLLRGMNESSEGRKQEFINSAGCRGKEPHVRLCMDTLSALGSTPPNRSASPLQFDIHLPTRGSGDTAHDRSIRHLNQFSDTAGS